MGAARILDVSLAIALAVSSPAKLHSEELTQILWADARKSQVLFVSASALSELGDWRTPEKLDRDTLAIGAQASDEMIGSLEAALTASSSSGLSIRQMLEGHCPAPYLRSGVVPPEGRRSLLEILRAGSTLAFLGRVERAEPGWSPRERVVSQLIAATVLEYFRAPINTFNGVSTLTFVRPGGWLALGDRVTCAPEPTGFRMLSAGDMVIVAAHPDGNNTGNVLPVLILPVIGDEVDLRSCLRCSESGPLSLAALKFELSGGR